MTIWRGRWRRRSEPRLLPGVRWNGFWWRGRARGRCSRQAKEQLDEIFRQPPLKARSLDLRRSTSGCWMKRRWTTSYTYDWRRNRNSVTYPRDGNERGYDELHELQLDGRASADGGCLDRRYWQADHEWSHSRRKWPFLQELLGRGIWQPLARAARERLSDGWTDSLS